MTEFMKAEGGFDGFISNINEGYEGTMNFFKKVRNDISPGRDVVELSGNIVSSVKTMIVNDTNSSHIKSK